MKNEYPNFGGEFAVVDYNSFLSELITSGSLHVNRPVYNNLFHSTEVCQQPPFLATVTPGTIGVEKPDLSRQVEKEKVIEELASRYGRFHLQKIAYPRVRPKKTEAPAAFLSPAERLKFLKFGGRQEEKKTERVRGNPDSIAQHIVQFLADKGFV